MKTGMLGTPELVEIAAKTITDHGLDKVLSTPF